MAPTGVHVVSYFEGLTGVANRDLALLGIGQTEGRLLHRMNQGPVYLQMNPCCRRAR
jgi:hypothetical protein